MNELWGIISRLVQDCAKAVQASEIEVEEKRLEILDLVKKQPEELVEKEEIDEFLKINFPDPKNPDETAVKPGKPYFNPRFSKLKSVEEFPPIEKVLGVKLEEKDLRFTRKKVFLTEKAVEKVREVVAKKLGERKKEVLTRVVEYGLPKPVVETMNIELKVALSFDKKLKAHIPNFFETDVRIVPETIGKVSMHLRFERD